MKDFNSELRLIPVTLKIHLHWELSEVIKKDYLYRIKYYHWILDTLFSKELSLNTE